jgi:calpain-15
MLLNNELTYCEFKGFCECIGRSNLTEKDFLNDVLPKYHSTTRGLTLQGFKEYFKQLIVETKALYNGNDEQVWQWLENLGYDRDIYSIRSRCFILTLHSSIEVSATVRDAV